MTFKMCSLIALALWACGSQGTTTDTTNDIKRQQAIDKAIDFLKTACVTSGSSQEIKLEGQAGITLRNLFGTGIEGTASWTKKELEGLVDAASENAGKQASEMRLCMQPYIDKILAAMIDKYVTDQKPVKPENTTPNLTINTSSSYFKTKEFDKVIAAFASKPARAMSLAEVYGAGREIGKGMNKPKIAHYTQIALKNGLIKDGKKERVGAIHQITDKGINYILAKSEFQ
jgi:hypothetical protein